MKSHFIPCDFASQPIRTLQIVQDLEKMCDFKLFFFPFKEQSCFTALLKNQGVKNSTLVTHKCCYPTPMSGTPSTCLEPHPHFKNPTPCLESHPLSGTPSPCLEPHPYDWNPIPMSGTASLTATPSPCLEPHPHVRNPHPLSRTPSPCLESHPKYSNPPSCPHPLPPGPPYQISSPKVPST